MRRIAIAGWFLTLAVTLALCTGCAPFGPPPTPSPPVRVTTPPTATPFPSYDLRRITVAAADGVTLVGDLYPPDDTPAPGVLLLHMEGGQKEDWASFATRLQEAGYAVLALDLRGHGESGGEVDWAAGPDDVGRAWAVLVAQPEVDPERTAVVGAGVGANLALGVAAARPQVRAAVLLSPGLDYEGVSIEERMAAYGERPVLIVASQDDVHAAESAQTLAGAALGEHVLMLYRDAGHGTGMFERQPDLTDLLLGWLQTQLR